MTMTATADNALATLDVDTEITSMRTSAVAVLNRSEVEMQLDAAHRYPRSIGRFLKEATALATMTGDVAASCIYSLPRGGKSLTGPSVRLAEICASAYGNLHIGARVLDAEEKEIVSQGVAWDLEKNLRVTVEARRRITKKDGKRFDDDMITVTGNAAASIALRNAIFRVIPKAYVEAVYAAARTVAVGDAKTLGEKRVLLIERFGKLGVTKERVLARIGKQTVEDIGLEDLELLIGIGTAIKNEDARIEDHFPESTTGAPQAPTDAKAIEDKLRAGGNGTTAGPKPEPKPAETAKPAAATPKPTEATEPCLVCGKPVATSKGVETTNGEGVVGRRHSGCSVFGQSVEREPGEEG